MLGLFDIQSVTVSQNDDFSNRWWFADRWLTEFAVYSIHVTTRTSPLPEEAVGALGRDWPVRTWFGHAPDSWPDRGI